MSSTATVLHRREVDLADVVAPLGKHLQALEHFLEEQVEAFEPEIRPVVRYCLRNKGKQLRPILVFFSGWVPEEPPDARLVKAAAIVELVHLATLVHDDILDDAELRHQTPTTKEEYDTHTAVLAGDALFSHALDLASSFPTVEVCRAVARATRRVCTGEIEQTLMADHATASVEKYYRIIELKTAELFRVSTYLGALLSDSTAEQVGHLSAFGRHLGTAYQIFDDLADFYGDEAKIGKTLGTDLGSGKMTLPLLTLLDALPGSRAEEIREGLRQRELDHGQVASLMSEFQVFESVREAFDTSLEAAHTSLEQVAPHPACTPLGQLAAILPGHLEKLHKRA